MLGLFHDDELIKKFKVGIKYKGKGKGKGKGIPLQGWTALRVSRRFSLQDFKTVST